MLDGKRTRCIFLPMKRLTVLFLFSYISLINCGGGPSQDLSGLLLLLGTGGPANSFHCGQTVANPVSFSGTTDGATVADESGLIAALGGNNCETPSLTNNGNGTVTDSANRFMWTLCIIDGSASPYKPHTYSNPNCGAFTGSDSSFNQAQGKSICEALTFAGRSDWEMPDAIQTNSLRDTSSPYALGVFGTTTKSLPEAQLIWSSSYVTGTVSYHAIFSRYASGAGFYSGDVNTTPQGAFICVAKL